MNTVAAFQQQPLVRFVLVFSRYCDDEKEVKQLQQKIETWRRTNQIYGDHSCGGPWHDVTYYTAEEAAKLSDFLKTLEIPEKPDGKFPEAFGDKVG